MGMMMVMRHELGRMGARRVRSGGEWEVDSCGAGAAQGNQDTYLVQKLGVLIADNSEAGATER